MPGGPLEVGYGVSYLSIAIPVPCPHVAKNHQKLTPPRAAGSRRGVASGVQAGRGRGLYVLGSPQ